MTGGEWYSPYDDRHITGAPGVDIDHLVPLAEAWDSGAYAWTAKEREAYAYDLGDARALIAVSAASNRFCPATGFTRSAQGRARHGRAYRTLWSARYAPPDVLVRSRAHGCAHRSAAAQV